ncbi:UNVERIFIED_ORG: putative ArsR family transcriptional regulator [Agrobacterium larrymoorei]|nr:putative ArsR family transcriptional regulator [Agrobacterium larrymoorei]
MTNQGVKEEIPTQILAILKEYKRCEVTSITSNTLAKTLGIHTTRVTKELTALIKSGKVTYARNTQRAAQRFYQLAEGCEK